MLAEAVSPGRLNRVRIQQRLEVVWNHLFPGREAPLLEYPLMKIAAELQKRRLIEFVFDKELPAPSGRQHYGKITIFSKKSDLRSQRLTSRDGCLIRWWVPAPS
jgi:hypothetical protein